MLHSREAMLFCLCYLLKNAAWKDKGGQIPLSAADPTVQEPALWIPYYLIKATQDSAFQN